MEYQIKWVKVEKYFELTGDSVDAVMARRKAGKWFDGDQCKIVDGRLWVNLVAVEQWVEEWGMSLPAAGGLPAGRSDAASGASTGAYLSASELAALVGCKLNQRSKMASWLDSAGWPYVVDGNRLPKVGRSFHDAKMNGTTTASIEKYSAEPNRDAFKTLPARKK